MFSEKALFAAQSDAAKASTVGLVSQVSESLRNGSEMFPTAWVYSTVATIVGFVAHALVVEPNVRPSTGNAKLDAGLADGLKVATVLAVANAVTTGMNGKVSFSDEVLTNMGVNAAAFCAFHVLVAPHLPTVAGHQNSVVDAAKSVFTTTAVHLAMGGEINQEFVLSTASVAAGFVIYNKVVAPRLA